MADSIEHKIITAIVSRMALINGTSPYLTTVLHAEDSRQNWDQSELPAISVFAGTVTTEEADDEGIRVIHTMPVMIRGAFATSDDAATNASNARKFLADICRAIRNDDNWLVGGDPQATFTQEVSHSIEYAGDNDYEITGVQVEIQVLFRSNKFNLEA